MGELSISGRSANRLSFEDGDKIMDLAKSDKFGHIVASAYTNK